MAKRMGEEATRNHSMGFDLASFISAGLFKFASFYPDFYIDLVPKSVLLTDEENNHMEDSCDIEEYVCGDPKVDIRVGDEYQAEIPPLMPESKRIGDEYQVDIRVGRHTELFE